MATILSGHAIPIKKLFNLADHTYVTSDDGKVWPCWGRSEGGRIVCSGPGSSAAANCDSFPSGLAGILYGVTGVCHQTSNRVLFPSLKNVHKAKGSVVSYLLYGVLGMDVPGQPPGACPLFLAKAATCALTNISTAATLKAQPGVIAAPGMDPEEEKEAAFMHELIDLQGGAMNNIHMAAIGDTVTARDAVSHEDLSAGELGLLVKYRLRDDYDKPKTGQLVEVRSAVYQKTAETTEDIIAAKSTAEKIAQKVNDEIAKMQTNMKEVLGEADYETFMGHKETDIAVVDPDILAASMKNMPQ